MTAGEETGSRADDLAAALAAAAAGADELRGRYRSGGVHATASSKAERRNLVTDADRAAERRILDVLAERFPDDPIMSEETASELVRAPRYWCVDPLDGTNNFTHGIPQFCVSVGLVEDGVPIVGVIDAPLHGEVFATDGRRVTCNGEPVSVSGTAEVADGIFATGFAYRRNAVSDTNVDNFTSVLMACRGIRRFGSAALDLAWVAAGRFDGFWELWLSAWDVAAGAALVRAAGGRVTDLAGGDDWLHGGHVVAANRDIHAELRSRLNVPSFVGQARNP